MDFVGKTERHGEADETTAGGRWDHVALDPEARLVVSVVVGKRTADATRTWVAHFCHCTGGRIPWRIASDEYPAYADAIRTAYGQVATAPRAERPGARRWRCRPGAAGTAAHKHREDGRVVSVSTTLVFGTGFGLMLALAGLAVSRVANAAFVERHNGTGRGRCSRKGRKTRAPRAEACTSRPTGSVTSAITSAGPCGPCG